jgi:general secretion pathway protein G
MRNLHNPAALVLFFAVIAGTFGCSRNRQVQKEERALRQELFLLRSEIDQFTLDHHRPPDSLSELVKAGYLKEIPTDPFTGNKDTWKVERAGDLLEVHSGPDGIASDGSRYYWW